MRFDIVTLFPEMFERFADTGVVGRAVTEGHITLRFKSPREFGLGKHKSVDDTPYGGGAGMVMRVDCLVQCMEGLDAEPAEGGKARRILLTPQGPRLDQHRVHHLGAAPALMLVCGRYEGVDHRVWGHVDEQLSIGDYVLSGGELAAMVTIDAVARTLPGVLGNPASLAEESHSPATGGRLEYPQYTRPEAFRGERVPEVLLSGHHGKIAEWRRHHSRSSSEGDG